MANDFTSRPWRIDTQDANLVWNGRIKVKYVHWFNPTTAADLFQLTNSNDKVVLEGRAAANNTPEKYEVNDWWDGLKVPDLDSGVLYIYIA